MANLLREQVAGMEFLGGVYSDIEAKFERLTWEKQLRDFVDVLIEKHRQHFAGQHDPSGAGWAPLAQSTIDRKGHDTILFDTGRLRESVVGGADHIEDIDSTGGGFSFLTFGSSVEYGIFHDEGTSRMPARVFVGIDNPTLDEFVGTVADATVEGLKLGLRE